MRAQTAQVPQEEEIVRKSHTEPCRVVVGKCPACGGNIVWRAEKKASIYTLREKVITSGPYANLKETDCSCQNEKCGIAYSSQSPLYWAKIQEHLDEYHQVSSD